jgi:hypothetical protein
VTPAELDALQRAAMRRLLSFISRACGQHQRAIHRSFRDLSKPTTSAPAQKGPQT